MAKLDLEYLSPGTASRYDFYSFPKLLIHHEAFDDLDYGAKILYSLILSRASLSATNAKDFTDEQGRLYIIYTIEQVMKDLRCSNKTAVKMVKQLEEIGLIEKKKQGQGKPTLIFVKDFGTLDFQKCNIYTSKDVHFKKCNIYTSESVESTPQDMDILHSSYTNPSYTNSSKPNLILSHQDEMPNYDEIRQDVYTQIYYDIFKDQIKNETMLNDIIEIMVEIMASKKNYYIISGEKVPTSMIKSRIKKITFDDITLLIEKVSSQTNYIKNIKAYLIKSLYDLPVTTDTYYTNLVNSDMHNGAI